MYLFDSNVVLCDLIYRLQSPLPVSACLMRSHNLHSTTNDLHRMAAFLLICLEMMTFAIETSHTRDTFFAPNNTFDGMNSLTWWATIYVMFFIFLLSARMKAFMRVYLHRSFETVIAWKFINRNVKPSHMINKSQLWIVMGSTRTTRTDS